MSSRSWSSRLPPFLSSPPTTGLARARRSPARRDRAALASFPEGDLMFETSMLIGESFVAGTETPERVLNPKTEDVLLDLPEASLQQVDGAVTAAEKAFKAWAG